MAVYKVPQDVEADDKLIGPFSFRQFVYLLIAAGLVAAAVGLFQIFPLLAIIPLPPVLLFLALALPLKKDQPMETYLAALVSYYLKPHKRLWEPGQRESTILITAPKIVEDTRTRDISQEEATHRLSFLADIVDTQGYAIKGAGSNPMREDLIAEANMATDMFDSYQSQAIQQAIQQGQTDRHAEAIREMREAIDRTESMAGAEIKNDREIIEESPVEPKEPVVLKREEKQIEEPDLALRKEVRPGEVAEVSAVKSEPEIESEEIPISELKPEPEKSEPVTVNHSIIELANNADYSVATIAKEANRLKRKDEDEVFISLH